VLSALARAYLAQRQGLEALRWQAQALAQDPKLVPAKELEQALALALDNSASAEEAITLVENKLGARGVDALYALAMRPSQARSKTRLNQSLAKAEVRAHASPAALVALSLQAADSCEAKQALLPQAARDGDRRALEQLKELTQTRNCGPMGLVDCWPCLRQGNALEQAIKSIFARLHSNH
jgi:hypothetical protein